MNGIRDHAERYLAIRRGLGYKLKVEGRMLGQFVGFLDERGHSRLTVRAALEWAVLPDGADPAWWAARLTVIRGFARFLAAFDELVEIPPPGLLPRRAGRTTPPYLYSQAEIAALIHAARHLAHPLRAATFESFIGLMAATGIRTGEAMGLDRADPDLDRGVLLVRGTKFGKSRLVPLHPTTVGQLADYQRRRDELCPRPSTEAFFLSGAGTRLNHTNASKTFTRLLKAVDITAPPGAGTPRLYDLRHTFAVTTLVNWYAADADVAHRLPALSTYLGHVSPATTYWYLHACPQLMTAAAERLDRTRKESP
ncbi:tyrosine-type recombinase/integrase [Streptomyces blattellae]|uniref:tyrosine-type recombinase/integrase n=1 Tax=Streptomyces blattellae TaxID=2569855 RepID=UPI001E2DE2A7|nr:tyrosine-type recombinase/integrase [Streptomyces blattellae]